MDRNVKKNPQTVSQANSKSQWTSPQVWDVMVGKTQGGDEPAAFENVSGTYVTPILVTAAPS